MTIEIKLPPKDAIRWAVFGRHFNLNHLIERLADAGFAPPLVIADPSESYARDRRLLGPHGRFDRLDELADAGLAKVVELADVNTLECLDVLAEHGCNVGFSLCCRHIVRRPLIDFFGGKIFNVHGAMLPRERGGGINSWRILNGWHTAATTLHVLDEGTDTGAVIFHAARDVGVDRPTPMDFDRMQSVCTHEVLDWLVDHVAAGDTLVATEQDNDSSTYLPRLYSELNGALDLDWPVEMVERFVRAFSDPYPGAYTFEKERRLHIHAARVVAGETFHPYCNGKVVTVLTDGSVNIVAGGGMINVPEISFDGKRGPAGRFLRIRQTLMTPHDILAKARTTVPVITEMA